MAPGFGRSLWSVGALVVWILMTVSSNKKEIGRSYHRSEVFRMRGGGGGYHSFMNHKPWHPGSVKNMEKVWVLEQEEKVLQAKLAERARILEEERKIEALQKEELEREMEARKQFPGAEKLEREFFDEHSIISLRTAKTPFELYKFGGMILKRELEMRGMDSTGSPMDMAVRLFAVRLMSKEQIAEMIERNATTNANDTMQFVREQQRKERKRRKILKMQQSDQIPNNMSFTENVTATIGNNETLGWPIDKSTRRKRRKNFTKIEKKVPKRERLSISMSEMLSSLKTDDVGIGT